MEDNTWYGNLSDVESAAFGALAVIEPMIQKINLAEIINRHLPTDPQAEFDHGRVLCALTAAERKRVDQNPVRGSRIPTHRFTWTFDKSQVTEDEANDGYSVVVTTVPTSTHSADVVFTMFREQNLVEHANRQFKGPLAVRPVFLHTPQRVEALVFLLMIALMIYFLLQRTYRGHTPEDAPLTERRMTAAKILKSFSQYAVLFHHNPLGRSVSPTRLTSRQREILRRLEFPTPAQTLSRRLARPPD